MELAVNRFMHTIYLPYTSLASRPQGIGAGLALHHMALLIAQRCSHIMYTIISHSSIR